MSIPMANGESLTPFQSSSTYKRSDPQWGMAAPADVTDDMQTYQPYGAIEKLFYCRDPEVLIDGPAGTGKSLGILHKLYAYMVKWPRARGAILGNIGGH